MSNDHSTAQREKTDRRQRPTSPLDAFRMGGRRSRVRRCEEREGAYFLDRFGAGTLAMVIILLCLTIVDGVLTIELLDTNSEESNPLMEHLLTRGHFAFLLGKYLLTAAGIPFIVVYKNYPFLGTRFRVGYLLPVFIALYLLLISYQWMLLQAGPPGSLTAAVSMVAEPCLSRGPSL
jgi:hypothetical protein